MMHSRARRLEQLELAYRRLKRVQLVTVALAAIAAGVLMGYAGVIQAAETDAPLERVTVQKDGVPVYSRMDTSSIVILQLMRGDLVQIAPADTTPEGPWCSVREIAIWGRSGYVLCKDLKPKQPPAEAPPHATDRPKEKVSPELSEAPKTSRSLQKPPPKTMASVTEPKARTEKRYTVQVAALAIERNALALKARLERLGYRPIIHVITAPITRHQVYAGESISQEEAERIAQRSNRDGLSPNIIEVEGGEFRVAVGSFLRRDEAVALARDLQKQNYTPKIQSEAVPTSLHVVRVGEFTNLSEAQMVLQALKEQEFSPLIVRQ